MRFMRFMIDEILIKCAGTEVLFMHSSLTDQKRYILLSIYMQ